MEALMLAPARGAAPVGASAPVAVAAVIVPQQVAAATADALLQLLVLLLLLRAPCSHGSKLLLCPLPLLVLLVCDKLQVGSCSRS